MCDGSVENNEAIGCGRPKALRSALMPAHLGRRSRRCRSDFATVTERNAEAWHNGGILRYGNLADATVSCVTNVALFNCSVSRFLPRCVHASVRKYSTFHATAFIISNLTSPTVFKVFLPLRRNSLSTIRRVRPEKNHGWLRWTMESREEMKMTARMSEVIFFGRKAETAGMHLRICIFNGVYLKDSLTGILFTLREKRMMNFRRKSSFRRANRRFAVDRTFDTIHVRSCNDGDDPHSEVIFYYARRMHLREPLPLDRVMTFYLYD